MIRNALRAAQARVRLVHALLRTARDPKPKGRPHNLPGPLIVSLPSYPARFPALARTIRGLLNQTIRADRTVLWLAEEDVALVPQNVSDLRALGLEIRTCVDLRSFKKIIPSLKAWPDAYIVTADDDLYYEPRWLEKLVDGVVPGEPVIVCRRAHLFSSLRPYKHWHLDFITSGELRDDLFPTGCGGVVYPPDSLDRSVMDVANILSLCPDADDVWLYVMGKRRGVKYRQVGGGFAQISWGGTQGQTLGNVNIETGNDQQLAAVMKEYPLRETVRS